MSGRWGWGKCGRVGVKLGGVGAMWCGEQAEEGADLRLKLIGGGGGVD